MHQVDLAGIFDEKLQRNKEQFGVTETYNTTREQIPLIPTTSSSRPSACRHPGPGCRRRQEGAQVLMFGVGPQEAHFEMNTYDIYKKQLTIQGSFINR